ncbi:MAG: insulinase family protein [Bacteroidetes bacterium]|nr:insulinase family protein [Bacteroidota bacterium]
MKKYIQIIVLIFISAFAVDAIAQAIPLDSRVKKAQLANGLTYYIMQNSQPKNKVELRLVVNAGSILEDDDQQGLAHFLEHMLFNGTTHFKKNELVDYLQQIGVKFGADLNAYTSFDETVFILPIPTERPEIVEKGFQVLEDWAHNALLEESEIDKERGVVLEEYRLGLGADKRMWEKYLPEVLKGSRYAERLPIGKKEILETFKPETLRRFYRDWYRPDLMSVVVVGDLDAATAEAYINKYFSGIKGPENPKPRPVFSHPAVNETRICVASDKEATNNTFNINIFPKQPNVAAQNETDLLRDMIYYLHTYVFYERCEDISQKPNAPFAYAGSNIYPYFSRTNLSMGFYGYFDDKKASESFHKVYSEMLKLKKFGIQSGELDRAKKNILAYYENQFNDRSKTNSEYLVYKFLQNFLSGEPAPDPEWQLQFLKKYLDGITPEMVNAMIGDLFQTENIAVVFELIEKEGTVLPTKEEVTQWMQETEQVQVIANVEETVNSSLMKQIPTPVRGYKIKKTKAPGVKMLQLKNGLHVYYKITDFKDDEISFKAFSPGGTSTIPDSELKETSLGMSWISSPTLNGMNPAVFSKVISGKNAWVGAGVSGTKETLTGSSGIADLETMMQWTHLYFTSLEKDRENYDAFVNKRVAYYSNFLNNPAFYFQMQCQQILANGNPRYIGFPTEQMMKGQNYESVFSLLKEKYSNAADFEFFYMGNLDEKKFIDYCETYLASLPVTGKRETKIKHTWPMPQGPIDSTIYKGTDPKATVNIIYSAYKNYDPKLALYLDFVAEILEIKLVEILREEASGVYGVGAYAYFTRDGDPSYSFYINFPCGPENVDKLSKLAIEELNKIIQNGPDPKDLAKVKEAKRLELEKNLRENSYWLGKVTWWVEHHEKLGDPAKGYKKIEDVTAAQVQKTAKDLLSIPYYKFVLLPEK